MKRILSILLMCSMILLTFTACMSEEEKQQAKENEKTAKSAIERYVKQNYSGATVKDVECLTYTRDSLFASTHASDIVKAKVSYNGKSFNVAVDLETKEFYNDYNRRKISEEIQSLLFSNVSVQKPKDVEVKFISDSLWYEVESKGWGFLGDDINSAKDLLASSEYKVCVVCKYIQSDMDFESISVKPFFKENYNSDIEISFVNYRDLSRYDTADVLGYNDSVAGVYNDEEGYYSVEDIKFASLEYFKSSSTDDETFYESEYTEEYKHYKSETVNNVEFIWNDEYYDIDFSLTDAEPVVTTEYYSGEPFYAKSKKLIKLDCTKLTMDEMSWDNCVYMYFDTSLKGEYVIAENNGSTDVKSLDWERYRYIYQWESLRDPSHEITLGFYRRAETNN